MTQSGVRAFSTLRASMGAFAAVVAGSALARMGRQSLEWAAGLGETARQIGVTVEQLQVLRLAAEQNGASVETMERAVAILNRTLGQAQAGLPAAVQSFRALGFTPEQIARFRNAGEAFPQVAQAISRFRTEAQQAAAAQRIFGRGASALLPVLTQGAAGYDRATQAAIRNGMVTEEQARKADEAADALGALASALRVQLLGAIVDSLPGLLQVVNVLGQIISFAIRAIGLIAQVVGQVASALSRPLSRPSRQDLAENIQARNGTLPVTAGRGLLGSLGTIPRPAPAPNLNLGSSPRGGGGGQGRQNNESARRRHQYESELRQLLIDELNARRENVEDLDQRRDINNSIAALERQQWVADQKFAITQGELTVAQYRQLVAAKQNVWTTESIGRTMEHTRAGQEVEAEIAADQAQAQEETLRSHIELARTAAERRRLELELLEITYRQRRNALQLTIQQRPGSPEARRAEAALADLPGRQRADERRMRRSTMGPLEGFIFDLPQTAEQIREALQSIAVDGLQAISDGLVDVMTGARKMGDVFKSVVTSIIADLLRIQIQKAIIGPLANILGNLFGGNPASTILGDLGGSLGLPGRAAGGPVLPGRMYVVGEKGPELLRMGNTGGHVIANDNIGGSGDVHVHQTFKFDGVAVTKDEFVQGLFATRQATLQAVREGNRRRG